MNKGENGGQKSPVQAYRCLEDGRLLTDDLIAKGHCVGHKMIKDYPTLWERIKIRLGLMKIK